MAPPAPPGSFDAVIAAGVAAQKWVPGCVAVGGSAAALLAHHRVSHDTDHLLSDLTQRFPEVLALLEGHPEWRTARVQAPVLILGSIGGVQVGLRQARHQGPIETITLETAAGPLVIPTLDEMLGMKAYLAYSRNATRDYLDFAALSANAGVDATVDALLKSAARYGHLQTASITMSIAERLMDPAPYDLASVDLGDYKGLLPEWRQWARVRDLCREVGRRLGEQLVLGP